MKKKLFLLACLCLVITLLTSCTIGEDERITTDSLDLEPTPTPSGPSLYSFIVLGDNGSLNPVFETIINEAEASDAAFVIHAGDITDGKNVKELTDAKEYLDTNLDKPYYVAIGDNDYMVDNSGERTDDAWRETFGETMQSFNYENSHFIIFNSTDENNSFSDAELDWLEKDLAKNNSDYTFLVMHIPIEIPMSESLFGEPSAQVKKQNQRFRDIIKEYDVDQIYAGHFHGYLNYEIDNIPVAVTGGAGSSPQFGFEEDYHYLTVTVYEDGFVNKYTPVDSLSL